MDIKLGLGFVFFRLGGYGMGWIELGLGWVR